jgi:lysophospholipase L1-like esterase
MVEEVRQDGKGLIWIRTTPVDEEQHRRFSRGFNRLEADAETYNRIADEVMTAAGVQVIDLHAFTASLPGPLYRDHVHFHAWVSRAQAGFLRREFDRILRPDNPPLFTFLGDSITDAERDRGDPESLGRGYVARLAELRPDARFRNLGISGNRLEDLRARLDEVPLDTTELTLYGGINHVVHIFKRDRPETPADFEAEADALLTEARRRGFPLRVMLPFLREADPDAVSEPWRPYPGAMYQRWRAELDSRLDRFARLCRKHGIPFLSLDTVMSEAENPTADGVHPNGRGHHILARAWLEARGEVRIKPQYPHGI